MLFFLASRIFSLLFVDFMYCFSCFTCPKWGRSRGRPCLCPAATYGHLNLPPTSSLSLPLVHTSSHFLGRAANNLCVFPWVWFIFPSAFQQLKQSAFLRAEAPRDVVVVVLVVVQCSIFNVKCWMLIRERLLDARYSRRVVQVYSPLPPLHHPEALHNFCLLWRRAWGVSIEPYTHCTGSQSATNPVANLSSKQSSGNITWGWRTCQNLWQTFIRLIPSLVSSFDTFFFYISHSHKADTGYASSAFYCLHTHWQLMSGNGRTRCHIRH